VTWALEGTPLWEGTFFLAFETGELSFIREKESSVAVRAESGHGWLGSSSYQGACLKDGRGKTKPTLTVGRERDRNLNPQKKKEKSKGGRVVLEEGRRDHFIFCTLSVKQK